MQNYKNDQSTEQNNTSIEVSGEDHVVPSEALEQVTKDA